MRAVLRSAIAASVIGLSSLAGAQQRPAIRTLGAVAATSTEPLSGVFGLRQLPDGRVIINDLGKRRVLMFDPSLAKFTVIADSTSATANAYSGRIGGLIAYRGDSTIFVDPTSMSMLVLDGSGKVARVMSVPRSQDAFTISGGGAAVDGSGRLVYRAQPNFPRPAPSPSGAFTMPDIPDSAAIVRIDLASRKMDTVGFIKTPKVKFDMTRDDNGRVRITSQINPLPVVDDWAMLPDGSVAFVRGRDYHVDFVGADGARTSAAKVPFDWQRMTDEDKTAFLDSLKVARERLGVNAPGVGFGGLAGALGGPGLGGAAQTVIFGNSGPGGDRAGGPGGASGAGGGNVRVNGPGGGGGGPQLNFVPASELPDYKPPFFAGQVRADPEGNLWVRTIPTKAIPGGPVYDVLNRKGELVERVQIPDGRTIVGFGPNGSVFLAARKDTSVFLERATVR